MNYKKITTLILAFVLAFTSVPVYANTENLDSSNKEDQSIAIEARKLIEEFIPQHYNEESGWNTSTKIGTIQEFYNFEDEISGFIFNITTEGIDDGYAVVNIYSDQLFMMEFGYNQPYYLMQVGEFSKNIQDATLYQSGFRGYFLKDASTGQIRDAESGEAIDPDSVKLIADHSMKIPLGVQLELQNMDTESTSTRATNVHLINDLEIRMNLVGFKMVFIRFAKQFIMHNILVGEV